MRLNRIAEHEFVTVVSGIPRSGTSMMMRMLSHGGLAAACDSSRGPDEFNPLGYYECEWVKHLGREPSMIVSARGKCVKVVSELVPLLPEGERYLMVFMLRSLSDVAASQLEMAGASLGLTGADLVGAFSRHLLVVKDLIDSREDICCLYVRFEEVLADPMVCALRVSEFLDFGLNAGAMAEVVLPAGPYGRLPLGEGTFCSDQGDLEVRERVLKSLGYL